MGAMGEWDDARVPRPLADILELHPLLPTAWAAATRAADFLVHERGSSLTVMSKTSPVDAVTAMDIGAEERVVSRILEDRPEDAILGEEGGERAGTSGVRWIIDPLDGTVNYLYRFPDWAVSIAAEDQASTLLGVIVAPLLNEAYVGLRGRGSWVVHGDVADEMRVGTCADLSRALVGTGFGYLQERRLVQGRVVAQLLGEVRDIRRRGAATLDLVALARGRLDGYYELGLQPWDYAAGALIAAEAGARVGSLDSEDVSEGTFVGAVPSIFEPLREALRRFS